MSWRDTWFGGTVLCCLRPYLNLQPALGVLPSLGPQKTIPGKVLVAKVKVDQGRDRGDLVLAA